MWKLKKPISLADFVTRPGGVTFFEELPGTAITEISSPAAEKTNATNGTPKKRPKRPDRSPDTDSDAVVKQAPGDARSLPPKKKRKRKTAGQAPAQPLAASAPPPAADPAAVIERSDTDISNWEVLHVPPVLLAGLAELGFDQPTEIQRLCLPAAIKGRMDVVGAAETGSGKTLAFALPMLYGVLKDMEKGYDSSEEEAGDNVDDPTDVTFAQARSVVGPKALVLAPTRELAIQVKNHMVAVAKYTGIKVVTVVGGMSEQKQQRLLSRKPEVIVATPGRLWEFVETHDSYLSNLSRLRFLVVDETDRMLEKGHFQQLHLLLERINSNKKWAERRQNFVFSATLTLDAQPAGRHVRQLKQLSLEKKLKHITSMIGVRQNNRKVVDITRQLGTAAGLTEMAISCSIPEKDQLLYYFCLQHPGRTLVFCNSIDCVTRLGRLFTLLEMAPLVLHASLQQRQRLKNLQRFQTARAALLLATDVAARGLDVPGVQHVIHYQVPRTTDAYVHRSGRTARAQAEGLSVMLVEPAEMSAYRRLLKQLHRDADLPPFGISADVLGSLSAHVTLACAINLAEHRQRRTAGGRSWRQRAAADMDLELDDRQLSDDEQEAERRGQAEVKVRRLQLRQMLARRDDVWAARTIHGRLEVPRRDVSALHVAKASLKNSCEPSTFLDDGQPAPVEEAEPTVAPPSDSGGSQNQTGAPPKKKRKTIAASAAGADKPTSGASVDAPKPAASAKRRRKKKWFARRGK